VVSLQLPFSGNTNELIKYGFQGFSSVYSVPCVSKCMRFRQQPLTQEALNPTLMDMEERDLTFHAITPRQEHISTHRVAFIFPSFRNVHHRPRYGVSFPLSPCSCQYYKRTLTDLTNPSNEDDVGGRQLQSLLKSWYCFQTEPGLVSSERASEWTCKWSRTMCHYGAPPVHK
jgi:hypothetical protein